MAEKFKVKYEKAKVILTIDEAADFVRLFMVCIILSHAFGRLK